MINSECSPSSHRHIELTHEACVLSGMYKLQPRVTAMYTTRFNSHGSLILCSVFEELLGNHRRWCLHWMGAVANVVLNELEMGV